jgi:hypothetical protein
MVAGGLPVAESDTQLAHTRPGPFSIYAGLPRWLADGMSVVNSGRSFFSVAPPMRCSDIVWVVVSPRPSHALGVPVVRHYVVAVRELFVADGTFSILFDDLPVQEFPHFCLRPEFPIPPWVMRILNAPYTKLYRTFLPSLFAATAED